MKTFHPFLRTAMYLLAGFGLMLPAVQTLAYTAGMPIDASFGNNGFANVPPYNGSYVVSAAFGFARLPLSGGYVVFTKQYPIDGGNQVVATRLTDAGTIDASWGTSGQKIFAVPVPAGPDTFVVVGVEGGVEHIYLVARYISNRGYLTMATFGADGTFLNYSTSDIPDSFSGFGVAEILAVEAGTAINGAKGIVIALKGTAGAQYDVAITTAQQLSSTPPGTIFPGSYGLWPGSAGNRINFIRDRGNGKTDILGTRANRALYKLVDFSTSPGAAFLAETQFDLPCASGTIMSSVGDGLVYPSSFAGDALVTGRVACSSGDAYSVAARIASIDSAPTAVWVTRLESGLSSACQPPFSAAACITANIAYDANTDAGEAFVDTTYPALAHLNLAAAPASLTGADFNVGYPTVVPSYHYGTDYQYPYLVALAATASQVGLARVAVDRVFADRFDPTP